MLCIMCVYNIPWQEKNGGSKVVAMVKYCVCVCVCVCAYMYMIQNEKRGYFIQKDIIIIIVKDP